MDHPSGLAVTEHLPADHHRTSPVVVLVHGSLDRSTSFARVLRRLPDLHTVTYDRRGYHRSRSVVPVATTLDGHIDDLLAVIAGRPAVVAGHSYGGTVALGATTRRHPPSTIRAVGAYEPPLPWLELAHVPPSTSRTLSDDPDAAAEQFFRRMVGNRAWERLPDAAREERRADGRALVAELRGLRGGGAPFDVEGLTVPAVFGRGGDSTPRHRTTVAWLAEHVAGSELVEVPGAGHGAHLSHPDAFADFVRRVARRVDDTVESAR